MKKVLKVMRNVALITAGSVITFIKSDLFCGITVAVIFYILWKWIQLIWEVREWMF